MWMPQFAVCYARKLYAHERHSSLGELSRSADIGPRDRLLSTDIMGLKLSGVIRELPRLSLSARRSR